MTNNSIPKQICNQFSSLSLYLIAPSQLRQLVSPDMQPLKSCVLLSSDTRFMHCSSHIGICHHTVPSCQEARKGKESNLKTTFMVRGVDWSVAKADADVHLRQSLLGHYNLISGRLAVMVGGINF